MQAPQIRVLPPQGQHAQALRVVVYAGIDPVTGRRVYERETVSGTDEAAWRKAENKLTELRAKVLRQQRASSSVSLGHAIDEWFRKAELEDSTRNSYAGYIRRVIKPILGDTPIKKLGAHELETLYAELLRCDGKPSLEHKQTGPTSATPRPRPRSARSTPSSAAPLNAAVRWGWIDTTPPSAPSRNHPSPIPRPGRRRPPRRQGIRTRQRLGPPGLARHDHRHAPRRGRRPPLAPYRPRHRDHRNSRSYGKGRKGHQTHKCVASPSTPKPSPSTAPTTVVPHRTSPRSASPSPTTCSSS